ncbi:MAG TPA: metallophosphoesterase [Verrucomicrobiota bacterium]|mgnify:CR=1 FL=1|nr:MAG: cyclic 3',5'-adenosine monophosphate phosphodiesterase [Verrucomicrobia bacterium ADurb.Bin118]HPY30163.1 metallophosphoesterase [Verrucomicrobiota bacterium]HQB16702.1 metallophosphoesterase [Verrucomicrobiota bacterium]
MKYHIAHFSDFHLCAVDDDFHCSLAMIDDAVERGVDHIVITGDIVDCAQMDVYTAFFQALRKRKLTEATRLTIIPGNHDIFPLSTRPIPIPPFWRRPTANFEKLLKVIRPTFSSKTATQLVAGEPFPVAKRLGKDVLLVALDTTRNEQYLPIRWAEGELPSHHRSAVRRHLARNSHVRHKIIVMHHSPWREEFEGDWLIEQNFTTPPPEEVRAWIKSCQADLLLCGHVHTKDSIKRTRIGSCRALRAGTSGGIDDDGRRIYHTISLSSTGQQRFRAYEF